MITGVHAIIFTQDVVALDRARAQAANRLITAGIPRKPGQSRDDLVASNLPIIRDVATNAKKVCPNAFVIVISNPLDAMVYEYRRVVGAPSPHVGWRSTATVCGPTRLIVGCARVPRS